MPFRYAENGHLTHGYAMTIHKAQGATVDSCRVLVGDTMNREQLYTALSRGRAENHLYLEDPDRRLLDRHARELTPTADQVLQAAVARSAAQQLAAEHDGDQHIPLSVLRAEQDRLRHVIAGQPPDPRPEMELLAEARRAVRHLLADAKADRDDSQRQLNGLGPMGRLLHRDRRAELEQRLDHLTGRTITPTGCYGSSTGETTSNPRSPAGGTGTPSTSPTSTASPSSTSTSASPKPSSTPGSATQTELAHQPLRWRRRTWTSAGERDRAGPHRRLRLDCAAAPDLRHPLAVPDLPEAPVES